MVAQNMVAGLELLSTFAAYQACLVLMRHVSDLEEMSRLQVEEMPIPEALRSSLDISGDEYRRLTGGKDPYKAAATFWDVESHP